MDGTVYGQLRRRALSGSLVPPDERLCVQPSPPRGHMCVVLYLNDLRARG